MKSKLYSVGTSDIVKGLVVAVLSAVLTWLLQALEVPGFDVYQIDYNEIGRVALSAGIAYIVKNYFSNSDGQVQLGSVKIG